MYFLGTIDFNKAIATKKNPELWEQSKREAKAKMGGKHSARAMQLATKIYKSKGGAYSGKRSSSNSMNKWTSQKWRTKSGKPSGVTGERYLPSEAIKNMSPQAYGASTKAKRAGTKQGKQFVPQTPKARQISKGFR